MIYLKEKIMKTRVLRGYETVGLTKDGEQRTKPVHRLIAQAFIPNPQNKPEVNHIDGYKLNNDLGNLEWVTTSENHRHAFRIGLSKAHDGGTSKMVARVDIEDGDILETYPSLRALDRDTTFLRKSVSLACRYNRIYRGYHWKFI